jgi:hypothetical protein
VKRSLSSDTLFVRYVIIFLPLPLINFQVTPMEALIQTTKQIFFDTEVALSINMDILKLHWKIKFVTFALILLAIWLEILAQKWSLCNMWHIFNPFDILSRTSYGKSVNGLLFLIMWLYGIKYSHYVLKFNRNAPWYRFLKNIFLLCFYNMCTSLMTDYFYVCEFFFLKIVFYLYRSLHRHSHHNF